MPRALDTIRQIKPPSRCTDEELIDRLMQGEFFKPIKGRLAPSPVEVMKAGPRSKQEARTIIKQYQELTNSGGGEVTARANGANRLPHQESAGVAPSPPETKTPWTEISAAISEKLIALSIAGLATTLAWSQFWINWTFWRSVGQTAGAADLFGYTGAALDLLRDILLPASTILWERAAYVRFVSALLGFLFCLGASTYASGSFASRNIDTQQAKASDLARRIGKLESERDQFVKMQYDNNRQNRLRAADWATEQIKQRDTEIRELNKQASAGVPDILNIAGKILYWALPTLCSLLFMIAYVIGFRA